MIAIYTHWATNKAEQLNQGFATVRDLALCLGLSIEKIKAQPNISKVVLVTNTKGKKLLIDQFSLPFDEVQNILDHLDNLDPNLWAYPKICAYANQNEPFIHLDNDVILFDELPTEILAAPLSFQNREDLATYSGYDVHKKELLNAGVLPKTIADHSPGWAFNCGIVAANDLSIIAEWKRTVDEFLFSPGSANYWKGRGKKNHSQNHMFEQYFISSIIGRLGIQNQIGLLLKNFETEDWDRPTFRMVHLWGTSKADPANIDLIARLLARDYSARIASIESAANNHSHVFNQVYENKVWGVRSGGGSRPEVVSEYVQFLQTFLKKNKIRSVVDFGCGYWEFNELINWNGAKYIGLDVVEKVIEDNRKNHSAPNRIFEVFNPRNPKIPKCDLILIKDVFIHWRNAEILEFFKSPLDCKFILATNDRPRPGSKANEDIAAAGQYHPVKLSEKPFYLETETVLEWKDQDKQTELLLVPSNV